MCTSVLWNTSDLLVLTGRSMDRRESTLVGDVSDRFVARGMAF